MQAPLVLHWAVRFYLLYSYERFTHTATSNRIGTWIIVWQSKHAWPSNLLDAEQITHSPTFQIVPLKSQFCTLNSLFTKKIPFQYNVEYIWKPTLHFRVPQCMVRSLLSGRSAVLCIVYDQLIVQGSVGQRPADPS